MHLFKAKVRTSIDHVETDRRRRISQGEMYIREELLHYPRISYCRVVEIVSAPVVRSPGIVLSIQSVKAQVLSGPRHITPSQETIGRSSIDPGQYATDGPSFKSLR